MISLFQESYLEINFLYLDVLNYLNRVVTHSFDVLNPVFKCIQEWDKQAALGHSKCIINLDDLSVTATQAKWSKLNACLIHRIKDIVTIHSGRSVIVDDCLLKMSVDIMNHSLILM